MHDSLVGIEIKKNFLCAVNRANVADILDARYKSFIQLCTAVCVDRLYGTETAVCLVTAFGIYLAGRMNFCTPLVTAVLSTIWLEVVIPLRHTPASQTVIVRD